MYVIKISDWVGKQEEESDIFSIKTLNIKKPVKRYQTTTHPFVPSQRKHNIHHKKLRHQRAELVNTSHRIAPAHSSLDLKAPHDASACRRSVASTHQIFASSSHIWIYKYTLEITNSKLEVYIGYLISITVVHNQLIMFS